MVLDGTLRQSAPFIDAPQKDAPQKDAPQKDAPQKDAPQKDAPQKALPVVKWAGGKRGLISQLLRYVPPRFSKYYEPFLGGAAFFFALAPACATIGDINVDLIEIYQAIRDDPERVMSELDELQPYALVSEYYYQVRAWDPRELPAARRAARFIYLNKTCYNGLYRVNRSGQFNVPFGRYAQPPALYNRGNMEQVSRLLRRAELVCADFGQVLAGAADGDFVYLDPPYVPLTSTANFTRYTSNAFGEPEQRRLADTVRELDARGCKLLLSNSDMPLVRALYKGFSITTVHASRNINSDAAGRSRIAELAIRNY